MKYLDFNLTLIDEQLLTRPPELGGLLLAGSNSPVFEEVILDGPERLPKPDWFIGERNAQLLAEREIARPDLRCVGTFHVHPIGIDVPSAQDVVASVDHLRRNPTLGSFHLHIGTKWTDLPVDARENLGYHELALPHGKVSCFVVHSPRSGEAATAIPHRVTVIPVFEHATALAASLDGQVTALATARADDVSWTVATIESPLATIRLWISASYPGTAPLVAIDQGHGEEFLPITWNTTNSPVSRLVDAVAPAIRSGSLACSEEGTMTDRVEGPLGGSIGQSRVAIFGLGSVGSTMAEQLVRTGAGDIVLIDPEPVAPANLSRTVYRHADIGRAKIDAATDHLRSINPHLSVRSEGRQVQEITTAEMVELMESVDIVIAATDDPEAQTRINAAAYRAQVPAVFVGLYAGAAAGEVIMSIPGITSCYRCAIPGTADKSGRPDTDYGTGRLHAEPALGCDIHRVTNIGVRVVLGLLMMQQGADTELTRQIARVLKSGEQFLVTSTVPDWDLFEHLLADIPGQHGFASAWMTVQRDPNCPICGDNPADIDTLLTLPNSKAIADLLHHTREVAGRTELNHKPAEAVSSH